MILHFQPAVWARTGHLQTILGAYFPQRLAPYRATARQLVMSDGDRIVVHDDCPRNWTPNSPSVVLMHGVGGCHQSNYLVRTSEKLNLLGVRTFRVDQRGVGAGAGLARSPGHAGRSEDLAAVVQFVSELCPSSRLSIIGFSLGGNIALRYAADMESSQRSRVQQVIAIAPPVDLQWCSDNLSRGFNRFYSKFWAGLLFRRTQRWPTSDSSFFRWSRRPRTLLEFDSVFTAPLGGFRDVAEYYSKSSAGSVTDRISVPTFVIAAADDPLIPIQMIREMRCSPSVCVWETESGGHCGYVGRKGVDPDRWWLDWRLTEMVTSETVVVRRAEPQKLLPSFGLGSSQ